MLNAFEAAVSVIVRASTSGESDANGTCRRPPQTRSWWISSATTHPVALERERGERLELFAAERAAGRVVRIAQEQNARARVGLAAQPLEIELVAVRAQRERILVEPAALLRDCAEKRRVDRRLHHDPVAGLAELVHRGVHALHHVGEDLHALGRDRPTVQTLHALRGQLGDRGRRGVDRIAEVRALDGEPQHAADRLGDREVHVGDPEREHVLGIGRPLLAAARATRCGSHRVEVGRRIAQRALHIVEHPTDLAATTAREQRARRARAARRDRGAARRSSRTASRSRPRTA